MIVQLDPKTSVYKALVERLGDGKQITKYVRMPLELASVDLEGGAVCDEDYVAISKPEIRMNESLWRLFGVRIGGAAAIHATTCRSRVRRPARIREGINIFVGGGLNRDERYSEEAWP